MQPQVLEYDLAITMRQAGREGIRIGDRFYPHSRIDYLELGETAVLQEGNETEFTAVNADAEQGLPK